MPIKKRKDRDGSYYLVTIIFPPGVYVPGEGGDRTTAGNWRIRKTIRGLDTAKAYEYERRSQLMRLWSDLQNGVRVDVPTLGEYVEEYRRHLASNRAKASTVATYEKYLRLDVVPFFGSMRLDQIKRKQISAFKSQIGKGVSVTNGCLTVVSSIMKLAIEDGHEFVTPRFRMLKPKPRHETIKYWTAEQTARVVAVLDSEPKIRNWVLLGLGSGLRIGELNGLRWSDGDMVANYIDVRQQYSDGVFKSPKWDSYRKVELTSTARAALLAQRSRTYMADGLVFMTDDRKPFTQHTYADAFKRLQRKAGVVVLPPKCMRHTFATRWLTEGGRIEVLSNQMGHKDLKTTQVYAQITGTARQRGALAFPDLLAGGQKAPLDRLSDTGLTPRISNNGFGQ